MLQDLLSEDNVSFRYPAETWEDVIRHGGQLMVDAGFTDPTYTEAMIDVVRDMGPYIVLAPGLAMPHARPEMGAKQVGAALVTLEKPIDFGSPENDPVSVAIFLCAPNKDEHIQLLTDIATLFEDEEFLDAAVNFESIEDVQSFLAEHLDEA
ncbi:MULTISPECIES: PTS sugar transporter subunit IIA [Veillonella]|uniref:Ascorbate-specific PTS system EIIA component n=1 Tax=Veillonella atypica TaxID=39777 RepID=A0A3A6W8E9_9FIRM|nr:MULTISPECIES: PTS sugar transporter subunit IIA [Veillonella]MBF1730063.1 PTS sugar transporter subunit IIA [Veillonella sp.]MBF1747198.1 PTS sugar transporter subunit IIA [Veillonella sp.]MBF1749452.1 PTS sugar transporter subunit IIA [Veillonella sp.]MBF1750860.1 PTS sugar transporter subunit IIA [Veillonella sp.]MBF1755253.1 PTS sugar transporter subunit IIA [Veillonella sp.]